jgi:hypothetical protein
MMFWRLIMNWPKLFTKGDAQHNSGVVFENIALPRFPGAGEILQESASTQKLGKQCSHSFDFGATNPVFDLTIANRGTSPVVIPSVGLRVETVAHSFLVGGVVEPRSIDISAVLVIRMPNIWGQCQDRGFLPREMRTLFDVKDMPPHDINEQLTCPLPLPVQLHPEVPFRFIVALASYVDNMPASAIIRFLAMSGQGFALSECVNIEVTSQVLHACSKEEFEISEYRDAADKAFKSQDFAAAEEALRKAIEMGKHGGRSDDREAEELKHNLGVLCLFRGRFDEAETLLQESLKASQRRFGANSSHYKECLNDLKALYETQGRTDKLAKLTPWIGRLPPK